jgi:hypothetical protein
MLEQGAKSASEFAVIAVTTIMLGDEQLNRVGKVSRGGSLLEIPRRCRDPLHQVAGRRLVSEVLGDPLADFGL